MLKKVLLLIPLFFSQVTAQDFLFNNVASPSSSKDAAACKKSAKSVVACSIANDYSVESGLFATDNTTCIAANSEAIENCSGGFAFTDDYPTYIPPYATAGGVDKTGSMYAYYQDVNSIKVSTFSCKSCAATLKKILYCALPAEVDPYGSPYEAYQAAFETCANGLTDIKDLYALEFCNSYTNFEPSVNDNNQIDYVDVHLSWDMGPVGETCSSYEALIMSSNKVLVRALKGNAANRD